MNVDLFDFDLPPKHIAHDPADPRDAARMLVITPGADTADCQVRDLPSQLRAGDILVCNNTQVLPVQLSARRGNAAIRLTLQGPRNATGDQTSPPDPRSNIWDALARPARKVRPGDILVIAPDFTARVIEKAGVPEPLSTCADTPRVASPADPLNNNHGGHLCLRFDCHGADLLAALETYGQAPLPPYIKRSASAVAADLRRYQTVFATVPGAVAAPTAGLHMTDRLLADLTASGIELAFLTLHVGPGTFLPVKSEDTNGHRMHAEWGCLTPATAARINQVRSRGGRVVACGTTSLRLLETATGDNGILQPFAGQTDIFITPGYRFKAADMLLTNFHLPRSTLFMLVSAFSGLATMKDAYEHAKMAGYRFYSYGDCCLLHPGNRSSIPP